MKYYFHILIWVIAYVILPDIAYTQSDSTSIKIQEPVIEKENNSPHSVYAGLGFGNNMVLASTVTTAQPYYYGSLVYGLKSKFFISASTFHMPEFEPFIAYSAFGLSYAHTFNTWFDISAGAYRYQVPDDLTDSLFSSFFYGNITLGVDWRLIYTKISFGGIISESSTGYLQMKNSRYFQTPEFFNKKAFISFDPYINLLMGTLTKTITDGETVIGIDSPIRGSGSGAGSGTGSGSGSGSSTSTTITSTFFGLMELDFALPVGFNMGNFTIEVEPGYVLPMYSDQEISSPEGFTVMINCLIKLF